MIVVVIHGVAAGRRCRGAVAMSLSRVAL